MINSQLEASGAADEGGRSFVVVGKYFVVMENMTVVRGCFSFTFPTPGPEVNDESTERDLVTLTGSVDI